MHCCVCSRVCHHVSPPSYCASHAPLPIVPGFMPFLPIPVIIPVPTIVPLSPYDPRRTWPGNRITYSG